MVYWKSYCWFWGCIGTLCSENAFVHLKFCIFFYLHERKILKLNSIMVFILLDLIWNYVFQFSATVCITTTSTVWRKHIDHIDKRKLSCSTACFLVNLSKSYTYSCIFTEIWLHSFNSCLKIIAECHWKDSSRQEGTLRRHSRPTTRPTHPKLYTFFTLILNNSRVI